MNRIVIRSALLLLGIFLILPATFVQGTAFTYQGRMNDNGAAATGAYDLRFALYNAFTNGTPISFPQTNFATGITNGLFTSTLDFGSVFTGTNYWLALGVRTNGSTNAFTLLWPRQLLTPMPYAIFANSASNLIGTLSATQLVGTLPSAQISGSYTGGVNFTNAGNSFSGTFFGTGSSLNSLNASNLSFGTVADARLTTNVALLDHNQIFTGTNIFTNRYNSFVGSFFGNGLVGWLVITGTTQQANINSGYVLISSNLTTLTLPTNAIVGDIVRISGAGSGGWKVAQNAGQSIAGTFFNPSNSTWLLSDASSAKAWQAIASSADSLKMVAGAGAAGGIVTSSDYGKSWTTAANTLSPVCLAASADGMKLCGAVFGGQLILSTNSGSTWQSVPGSTTNWQSIASSADGTKLVAVVNPGYIYTSANSGGSWTLQTSSPYTSWYAVASSADGTRLAAVVNNFYIYTSSDSGVTWNQQINSGSRNWTAITSSADGSKLAATVLGGNIYNSSDYGVTWSVQANSPVANWYAIASSADGGRLVAAVYGAGVYFSANYGLTWSKQPLPDLNWKAVTCSDDGSKAAAVYTGGGNTGGIYYWQATLQNTTSTTGTNGALTGSFGSAVELQYIGNGRFMPVSSSGIFWAN